MSKVYLFISAVIIVLVAATVSLFVSRSERNSSKQAVRQQEPTATVQQTTTQSGLAVKTGDIPLNISGPQNGQVFQVSVINVKGTTTPNAEVFVNDRQVKAGESGVFSVSLSLDEGENYILVAVADTNGGYSEKELNVTYEPTQ